MKRYPGSIYCTIILVGLLGLYNSEAATQKTRWQHTPYVVLTATQSSSDKSAPTKSTQPPRPTNKTIVADLLMVDGDFYVVRGERGEIRIEVTPDTKLSESFEFGDRIKALVRPDDSAISIERATPGESIGVFTEPASQTPASQVQPTEPTKQKSPKESSSTPSEEGAPSVPAQPKIRTIVADLLMIDGDFYVVRGERGEIRIEVKPDTQLSEEFTFGDRIKAQVRSDDTAIAIERAKADELPGIQVEAPATATIPQPAQPTSTAKSQAAPEAKSSEAKSDPSQPTTSPKTRTIVAEVLMVDGDFYVVRGERGEIRIEVTPETKLTEEFQFGDKIKAEVLPNDRAISVKRAGPDEPLGITE